MNINTKNPLFDDLEWVKSQKAVVLGKQPNEIELSKEENELIQKGCDVDIFNTSQNKLEHRDTLKNGIDYNGTFLDLLKFVEHELTSGKTPKYVFDIMEQKIEDGKKILKKFGYISGLASGGSASRFTDSIIYALSILIPEKKGYYISVNKELTADEILARYNSLKNYIRSIPPEKLNEKSKELW